MNQDVHSYRIVIEPLSDDMGGGFVSQAPELEGCLSDGATPEEALHNIYDAILCWLDTAAERDAPEPDRRYA